MGLSSSVSIGLDVSVDACRRDKWKEDEGDEEKKRRREGSSHRCMDLLREDEPAQGHSPRRRRHPNGGRHRHKLVAQLQAVEEPRQRAEQPRHGKDSIDGGAVSGVDHLPLPINSVQTNLTSVASGET